MKLADIEWRILGGAIAVFSICLLVSALLPIPSFHFRDEMALLFNQHYKQYKEISRKYVAIDEEERIIKLHYPRFVELVRHGVIGQEQRLSWVETLKRAGETIKIPSLRYEIDSREPYTPEFSVSTGTYRIYATPMKLSFGMLHENDLAMLLRELDNNASGLYSVKNCDFKRMQKVIERDPKQENIAANC
ncbi:MAG: hypothetical protein ACREBU_25645, partial [Nitrososphaera sp.]